MCSGRQTKSTGYCRLAVSDATHTAHRSICVPSLCHRRHCTPRFYAVTLPAESTGFCPPVTAVCLLSTLLSRWSPCGMSVGSWCCYRNRELFHLPKWLLWNFSPRSNRWLSFRSLFMSILILILSHQSCIDSCRFDQGSINYLQMIKQQSKLHQLLYLICQYCWDEISFNEWKFEYYSLLLRLVWSFEQT